MERRMLSENLVLGPEELALLREAFDVPGKRPRNTTEARPRWPAFAWPMRYWPPIGTAQRN